jgi:hypothetical protein
VALGVTFGEVPEILARKSSACAAESRRLLGSYPDERGEACDKKSGFKDRKEFYRLLSDALRRKTDGVCARFGADGACSSWLLISLLVLLPRDPEREA